MGNGSAEPGSPSEGGSRLNLRKAVILGRCRNIQGF